MGLPDGESPGTLGWLIATLGAQMVELVSAPSGLGTLIGSHAMVCSDDFGFPLAMQERDAEAILLVGVRGDQAAEHVARLASAEAKAIFVKDAARSATLRRACEAMTLALVGVHNDARWEHVHTVVSRLIKLGTHGPNGSKGADRFGQANDLFAVSATVAAITGGLVTIDDPEARVMAFSPLDDTADEVRNASILGRAAPSHYTRCLRSERVYQRLRDGEAVTFAPGGRIRTRLAVGIHGPDSSGAPYLGTMWVQEGKRPLHADDVHTLRAAASFAGRLINHIRRIPSADEELTQRILGNQASGSGTPEDVERLVGRLDFPATVVAFGNTAHPEESWLLSTRAELFMNFRTGLICEAARVAFFGGRLYVLLPDAIDRDTVVKWAQGAAKALADHVGSPVSAAVSDPVAEFDDIPDARQEADDLLDMAAPGDRRLLTSEEARTALTLRRALSSATNAGHLPSSQLERLRRHDEAHGSELLTSLQVYLEAFGDVRTAAVQLCVHPNTLRYRIRRASEVSGIDLKDPDSRLLLQLQLWGVRRP